MKRIPIKRTPMQRCRRKPREHDDPKYLAWIRTFPCIICYPKLFTPKRINETASFLGDTPLSEAAHVGERGLGQKFGDRITLPMCPNHHRNGKECYHTMGKRFWDWHGLDRDESVALLQKVYHSRLQTERIK